MIAARRGSPLLVGVKSAKKLKVDFVDVGDRLALLLEQGFVVVVGGGILHEGVVEGEGRRNLSCDMPGDEFGQLVGGQIVRWGIRRGEPAAGTSG